MITAAKLSDLLNDLPCFVRSMRRRQNLGIKVAAADIGISTSTLSRVENGHGCDVRTLIKLLTWVGR